MFPLLRFVVSVLWAPYCLSCSKMKMKGGFLEYILFPNRSLSVSSVISVSTDFAHYLQDFMKWTPWSNRRKLLIFSNDIRPPTDVQTNDCLMFRWSGYWAWIWSQTEIALYAWVEPFKPFKRICIPEGPGGREAVFIQSIPEKLEDRKLMAI